MQIGIVFLAIWLLAAAAFLIWQFATGAMLASEPAESPPAQLPPKASTRQDHQRPAA